MGTELQASDSCPRCGGTDLYDGEQDFGPIRFMCIKRMCNECGHSWNFYGNPHPLWDLIAKLDKVIEYVGLQRDFSFDEEPEDVYISYLFEVRDFLRGVIQAGR